MSLGKKGEELAAQFLKKKGYRIIKQNYRNPLGEIDIIAMDKEILAFIEVKTRESIKYGRPFEAITSSKKRKLTNVALLYLKTMKKTPPCRFDVVSIYYRDGNPECELIKDAFEL
jgi:putative endonuclease